MYGKQFEHNLWQLARLGNYLRLFSNYGFRDVESFYYRVKIDFFVEVMSNEFWQYILFNFLGLVRQESLFVKLWLSKVI